MAPSADRLRARRVAASALAAGGAVLCLTGCATTEQQAARLQLNAARIRTAERPTIVRSPGRAVELRGVSVLSTPGAHTVVLAVHNPAATAVSDLPVSLGVRRHGRFDPLNARSSEELSYYDAHLPRIGPGATITWVFTTRARVPRHAHILVRIGAHPSPVTAAGRTAPALAVRVTGRRAAGVGTAALALTVRNRSGIPQYQMPVYVVARRGARTVAAGGLIVPELGGGQTVSLRVPVRGSLSGARLHVTALPAIVH